MALTTYAELLTLVSNYDQTTSGVEASYLPDLVRLAEQRIFFGGGVLGEPTYTPPLRCRAMEKDFIIPVATGQDGGTSAGSANAQTVTLSAAPTLTAGLTITFTAGFTNTSTVTFNANSTGAVEIKTGRSRDSLAAGDIVAGGVYTVYYDGTNYVLMPSDGAAPLPSRWLGIKELYLQDRKNPLTFLPSAGLNSFIEDASADIPRYWSVSGDCLRVDPRPAGTKYLKGVYYKRPAALADSLNDIFREAPNIYLFATLLELAIFLPAEERILTFLSQYKSAVGAYMATDVLATHGHAPMKVRLTLAP